MGAALKLLEPLETVLEKSTVPVQPYPKTRFATDIKEYDTQLSKNSGKPNFTIAHLLGDMHSMALAVERQALDRNIEHLRAQLIRHNYRRFTSTDFLAQTVLVEGEFGKEKYKLSIQLPKWGIFSAENSGNDVGIEAKTDYGGKGYVRYTYRVSGSRVLLAEIEKALAMNFPKESYGREEGLREIQLAYNANQKSLKNHGVDPTKLDFFLRYGFSTGLNIEIPSNARKEIQKAFKIFGDENVYFIAERQPSDWVFNNVGIAFSVDPIVVGYHKEEGVFLVCRFDSTFNEAVVTRDYVEKKK